MELVINFSGGKDSCAMLAWLCEQYPHVPKHVVMADTGWEHPDAIDWSRSIVERFGLELHVVRNPNKTLITMARRRGKFPGMHQRQCTSDLKRGPVHTWIRRHWKGRAGVIVSCMGLRAEESSARAKRPCLKPLATLSKRGREVWDWNPILGWTEAQVLAYLQERSIPLHPVYKHLRRFSCRVCIYMTDHDLRQVAIHDPEAINIVALVEREIGFTMFQRGPVEQLAGIGHTGYPPFRHLSGHAQWPVLRGGIVRPPRNKSGTMAAQPDHHHACAGLPVAPYRLKHPDGFDWQQFLVGTVKGLWCTKDGAYHILSVINTQPHNGHVTDVFEWFKHSATRDGYALIVHEVMEPKMGRILLREGFVPVVGTENFKWMPDTDQITVPSYRLDEAIVDQIHTRLIEARIYAYSQ